MLREGQVATVLASYRLSREPAPSPITAIADKARRIAGRDLLRDSDFPHIHSNPLVLYDRELQQWQRVEPCIPATRRWVTLKEWKQVLTRRARDVGSTAENIPSPFECFDSAIDSLRNMLDDDGPARTRSVCRRLGVFNEYAILKSAWTVAPPNGTPRCAPGKQSSTSTTQPASSPLQCRALTRPVRSTLGSAPARNSTSASDASAARNRVRATGPLRSWYMQPTAISEKGASRTTKKPPSLK